MASSPGPAPAPAPSPAPASPPPETETGKRLRELETQFLGAVTRDVTSVYDKAVADLDTHYIAAVDRELHEATAAGNLDDAVALQNDKERSAAHTAMPATDPKGAPKSLRDLHQTYRGSIARFEADRRTGLRTLSARYAQVLAAYQQELVKAGKPDEAAKVSQRVDALLEDVLAHPDAIPASHPDSAPAAAAPTAAVAPTAAPSPPAFPAGDPRASLAAFLPGTVWQWSGRMDYRMEFLADGTVYKQDWIERGLKTGWEVTDANKVELKILSGRKTDLTAHIEFDKERISFGGTNFKPKDRLTRSMRVKPVAIDKNQKYKPGVIEGENLEVIGKAPGMPLSWNYGSLKLFSGGQIVLWIYAKPGDHLTLAVPVAEKGRYQVRGVLSKTHDSGIVDVTLDDAPVATGFDGYSEKDAVSDELDWGVRNLDAGEHKLRFTITGCNPLAKASYRVGFDYLRLEKK